MRRDSQITWMRGSFQIKKDQESDFSDAESSSSQASSIFSARKRIAAYCPGSNNRDRSSSRSPAFGLVGCMAHIDTRADSTKAFSKHGGAFALGVDFDVGSMGIVCKRFEKADFSAPFEETGSASLAGNR